MNLEGEQMINFGKNYCLYKYVLDARWAQGNLSLLISMRQLERISMTILYMILGNTEVIRYSLLRIKVNIALSNATR
jgi:hypothetical protein